MTIYSAFLLCDDLQIVDLGFRAAVQKIAEQEVQKKTDFLGDV